MYKKQVIISEQKNLGIVKSCHTNKICKKTPVQAEMAAVF
jgi:hypothetical protein